MVLNQLADIYDEGSECRSKEEMIAEMDNVNKRDDIEQMIVGSTDVKALYPSLLAIPSTDIIVEVFLQNELKIEGVDYTEVGKYLTINLSAAKNRQIGIGRSGLQKSKSGRPLPRNDDSRDHGKVISGGRRRCPKLVQPTPKTTHRW